MKENLINVKDFHKYQTRFNGEHNFIIPDCQDSKSHTFYYSAIKNKKFKDVRWVQLFIPNFFSYISFFVFV